MAMQSNSFKIWGIPKFKHEMVRLFYSNCKFVTIAAITAMFCVQTIITDAAFVMVAVQQLKMHFILGFLLQYRKNSNQTK